MHAPEHDTFLSPEYPVVYTVAEASAPGDDTLLSMAVIVGGVPSFLATVPVDGELLGGIMHSLDSGNVRISVAGVSVTESELRGKERGENSPSPEPWRGEPEEEKGGEEESGVFPGATLSVVCQDGRQVGVARVVSRDQAASPGEVARFILRQIRRGVQVPDLASAG
jgi:hypothetical protein